MNAKRLAQHRSTKGKARRILRYSSINVWMRSSLVASNLARSLPGPIIMFLTSTEHLIPVPENTSAAPSAKQPA
jgi:hypothetical protein